MPDHSDDPRAGQMAWPRAGYVLPAPRSANRTDAEGVTAQVAAADDVWAEFDQNDRRTPQNRRQPASGAARGMVPSVMAGRESQSGRCERPCWAYRKGFQDCGPDDRDGVEIVDVTPAHVDAMARLLTPEVWWAERLDT